VLIKQNKNTTNRHLEHNTIYGQIPMEIGNLTSLYLLYVLCLCTMCVVFVCVRVYELIYI